MGGDAQNVDGAGLDLHHEQDIKALDGITPPQQYQPAEHPDHEQADETDKHER